MAEEPKPAAKQNKFLHFISAHPFGVCIAFIASLCTIGGIPLAIYLWQAVPKPNLSYSVYPIRTPYVQTSAPSDVSISYKGVPVNGNVSAAQVAIWNAGKLPIRHEDILKGISLKLPPSAFVFEHKFLRVSRDVVGMTVTDVFNVGTAGIRGPNGEPAPANVRIVPSTDIELGLDWKILEHNDGALLQIVYAGTIDAPIKIDGTIVGQNQVRFVKSKPKNPIPWYAAVLCLAVISYYMFQGSKNMKKVFAAKHLPKSAWYIVFGVHLFAIVGTLGMCVLALWGIVASRGNTTPFGF